MSNLGELDAVINTSSLSSFIITDNVDLVVRCFRNVYVPEAVAQELSRSPYSLPQELHRKKLNPFQREEALEIGFGNGENEAIVLARDLKVPLLMDEQSARKAAKRFGLKVYGSLVLIRLAFESCLIQQDEYDSRVSRFQTTKRANMDLILWALKAEKLTPGAISPAADNLN